MPTESVCAASESGSHVHDDRPLLKEWFECLNSQDLTDHIDIEHLDQVLRFEGGRVVSAGVDAYAGMVKCD